jgi:hypothetical protein
MLLSCVKCHFNGKDGLILLDQLRNVDKTRLIKQLGELERLTQIDVCNTIYIYFLFNQKVEEKDVSASNTLVTKIMLGTIGCVPAYDRFFIDGLKQCDILPKSAPSKKSL